MAGRNRVAGVWGHKAGHQAGRAAGRGFSIIEVIVIVVILGIIAAVIAPRLFGRIGQAKESVAKSGVASLATAMRNYMVDNGLPESGSPITILWERPSTIEEAAWKGPYVENPDALKDPWGNMYVLVIPPQFNADFDVVSYGADGQQGGEGEAADLVNGKK
jgi:general secretion pathway protein G